MDTVFQPATLGTSRGAPRRAGVSNWLRTLLTLLYLTLFLIGPLACSKSPATSETLDLPLKIVSVREIASQTPNPGGPEVEITLKNVSNEAIISLNLALEESDSRRFTYDFIVSPSSPLGSGKSAKSSRRLIGGGWGDHIPYVLAIFGMLRNGAAFDFTWQAGSSTLPPINIFTVPVQLNFFTKPGISPPAKELDIGVANRVSAAWSARAGQPWISITPVSGETAPNFTGAPPTNRTEVSVDSSTFHQGEYSANITLMVGGLTVHTIPVWVFVTDTLPGQILAIPVGQGIGSAWAAGVSLMGPAEVSTGILERSLSRIEPNSRTVYNSGDMSVFVKGTFANDSDQEWQLDFWPQAFDSEGNEVAWGLDQGGAPFSGHLQMNVPAHGSRPFTLHLTWDENISKITINANKYPPWPPLP